MQARRWGLQHAVVSVPWNASSNTQRPQALAAALALAMRVPYKHLVHFIRTRNNHPPHTHTRTQVLAAALALSPRVPDEHLVHFIRAALATVLGQPLVEAGQGDTVETAEALWDAACGRGLQAQVRRLAALLGKTGDPRLLSNAACVTIF